MGVKMPDGRRSGVPDVPGYVSTDDVLLMFETKNWKRLIEAMRAVRMHPLVCGSIGKRPTAYLWSSKELQQHQRAIRARVKGARPVPTVSDGHEELFSRLRALEARVGGLEGLVASTVGVEPDEGQIGIVERSLGLGQLEFPIDAEGEELKGGA